ncbi:hypothetical protein [Leeuwenhoekiella marinoflava]|uniref:Uncharacterized protein n=3 Tax=Leeuwenhoekiella marinoflava TaxID=988 RepID=A0A4Q0PJE9_9FLAO|nr:hypothetical protein [Leeuwenhoekiella marinoflava]RXG27582.1 hypothetical protein DSL99_2805 [Leeuwenhoekiella marinoflava]SHF66257.1 hypothetical protein SAMN02745246_03098 [Leeuwenhoekiella marinoflava DSM 3653]
MLMKLFFALNQLPPDTQNADDNLPVDFNDSFLVLRNLSAIAQRRTNKRKNIFWIGIFRLRGENHNSIPKFLPRLQKFLTGTSCYTEKKEG